MEGPDAPMTEPARPADEATPQWWPPELDSDYELVGEQGRGGMAVVFRARDRSLGRDVAVKVVRPRFAADAEAVARLAREARTVAQLEHPNIVGVYSIRHLGDGSVALVMQLIPGRTLKQAIVQDGPFPVDRVEHVLRDVARALAYAHRAGVVHRDVKPENIFLDDVSGRAMLSDFGVARVMDAPTELTATGTTIGTPTYMAPEQIDGVQLDGRSDLYSLGMVGWEMVTGERPWAGESLYSVIYRQKHDQLTPIDMFRDDIPSRLQYLIEGLMPKNPDRRWASAARFLTLLASDGALPGFKEWESAQRRRRRSRVFKQARQRGDSVIGAALETVKFARPPAPVAQLASPPGQRATPVFDTGPIAGEQPGAPPPPDESGAGGAAAALRRPTPARAMRPTPSQKVGGIPSGGYSIKRTPADPAYYGVDSGVVSIPSSRPKRLLRVAMALLVAGAGGGYWWFTSGPGATRTVPAYTDISVTPRDQGGVEVPVIASADSQPAPADSTPPPTEPAGSAPPASSSRGFAGGNPNADSARLAATPPPNTGRTVVAPRDSTQLRTTTVDSTPVTTPALPLPEPVVPALTFPQDRGSVAAGSRHTCLLDNNGQASCWGSNEDGQLGDGTYETRATPDHVLGDFTFTMVTAGASHTCALTVANEVLCWGANQSGQLGDGQTTARTAPVRLLSTVSFRLIRAGRAHTCGLSISGAVFCWGANAQGQLGDRTRTNRTSPVAVDLPAAAAAISVGWNHTCALTVDGSAYCWGDNSYGQLGDGSTTARPAPQRVRTDDPLVSIAAGLSHSCGVTKDGAAVCWGRGNYGQTGAAGADILTTPREVAGHGNFTTIVAGSVHTCARARDGSGWCWGRNIYGQLGDGSTTDRFSPVPIRGVARLTSLNAGGSHTCATGSQGEAWCWGYNVDGQIGRGDKEPSATAIRVSAPPR